MTCVDGDGLPGASLDGLLPFSEFPYADRRSPHPITRSPDHPMALGWANVPINVLAGERKGICQFTHSPVHPLTGPSAHPRPLFQKEIHGAGA
jgi:hypothetical protein